MLIARFIRLLAAVALLHSVTLLIRLLFNVTRLLLARLLLPWLGHSPRAVITASILARLRYRESLTSITRALLTEPHTDRARLENRTDCDQQITARTIEAESCTWEKRFSLFKKVCTIRSGSVRNSLMKSNHHFFFLNGNKKSKHRTGGRIQKEASRSVGNRRSDAAHCSIV